MDESRFSKKHCEDYRNAESDRLSELPDTLLLVILSLLEMKDVVRTTILSKRWKDVWTTVPCLDFCGENNPSFIEGALAKWKGAKILKFSLRFCVDGPPPSDLLDSWLLVPIEKQVEDLFLYLDYDMDYEYCAPQPLNSCSSITRLSLFKCNLKIEENVRWNQLKSLEIEGPSYLSEDASNRIISGAPLLEELKLLSWNISENLNIRSTSLKMLKIELYIFDFADFAVIDSVLSIWAPNLESLEISGEWHTRCLLNVPSLTTATLGLTSLHYYHAPSRYTAMRQAFLGLSHVQKLTLNGCAIKFLYDEIRRDNYVHFPKLVMLIVEQSQNHYHRSYHRYSLAPPNTNTIFPCLSLLQLKTVVITWDVREASIFGLLEILLENAHALDKMVIRLRKHYSYRDMQYILDLEKVVSLHRASPHVNVIISTV